MVLPMCAMGSGAASKALMKRCHMRSCCRFRLGATWHPNRAAYHPFDLQAGVSTVPIGSWRHSHGKIRRRRKNSGRPGGHVFGGVEAVTSNFVARLRPARHVSPGSFSISWPPCITLGFSHQFIKQNIGIQNLDDAAFLDTRIYLPDWAAQQHIADFLDRETVRLIK